MPPELPFHGEFAGQLHSDTLRNPEQKIPRSQQGLVVFLTGLSGAGKSTLAEHLNERINQIEAQGPGLGRVVTVLDGDVVRTHLSRGLGYSREDRDTNVRRVGFVAGLLARSRGVAVTALIAPYQETRDEVRAMVEEQGGHFVEVHVSTPLEQCEARDVKGLYAAARRGERPGFTGIDDPYEIPQNPELRIDTTDADPASSTQVIIDYLQCTGYLATPPSI
jgi:sulfate adenylyltransferase